MKVFIVDDEVVIRVGLKSLIDWEEHGYTIIGEASDGEKALDAIGKLKPDVLITDIKMPVMDGIELIRQLSKTENAPKIIVLSSYNDFPLVKEAMRLGAADYLLKLEMTPEVLLSVMNELRRTGSAVINSEEQQHIYEANIRKNIHVLKQKFFKDILNFHMSDEELRQSIELYDIKLNLDHVCCLVLKITNTYGRVLVEDKDIELLNYSIINIVEEMLNEMFIGHCFDIRQSEFCAVVSLQDEEQESSAAELLETIVEMLRKYLNVDSVIGSGGWRQGIEGLKQSYREARQALDICVSTSQKVVVSWAGMNELPKERSEYSIIQLKDQLFETLQFGQSDRLSELFTNIKDELSRRSLSLENQINVCLELHYMLVDFFAKNNIQASEILGDTFKTPQQIMQTASFRQVLDWLDGMRNQLIAYITMSRNGGSRVVLKAKKYIADYYMNNITLNEVANEVNLSPFYLSNLFVQHAGVSFTDYLTYVRIEKGKELLKETDLKVYEIGEMIGYRNTTYFNKIFKKTTGLTPIAYRNQLIVL